MLKPEEAAWFYNLHSKLGEMAYYVVNDEMIPSKSLRVRGNSLYFASLRADKPVLPKIAARRGFMKALQENRTDVDDAMRKWVREIALLRLLTIVIVLHNS